MNEGYTIRPAVPDDLPEVASLLERSKLPVAGAADHLKTMVVAEERGRLIGTAALELYDRCALLRSVAVDTPCRGSGVGQALTRAALELACQRGVTSVFLLTETAGGFFPRFGFRPITRAEVPPAVQTSIEFTTACPASALVMVRQLD